jgi:transcription termination/antitermination protein NusG
VQVPVSIGVFGFRNKVRIRVLECSDGCNMRAIDTRPSRVIHASPVSVYRELIVKDQNIRSLVKAVMCISGNISQSSTSSRENPTSSYEGWFVVQVVPRLEKRVAFMLECKGYEQYLPLMTEEARDRALERKPLFPGYVFCRFRPDSRGLVVKTPGVIRLLGHRRGPVPLEADEMRNIHKIVDSGIPVQSCELITLGSKVVIESGPLRGIHGILIQIKGARRIAVSVEMLCRSITVALNAWEVRPLLIAA